jgi:hypothetical protein
LVVVIIAHTIPNLLCHHRQHIHMLRRYEYEFACSNDLDM